MTELERRLAAARAALANQGIAVVRGYVGACALQRLQAKLAQLTYPPVPEFSGPRQVQEQMGIATLGDIAADVTARLEHDLVVRFTERSGIFFWQGSIGASPHREFSKYKQVIAHTVIQGRLCYSVYPDHGVVPSISLEASAGDVLLWAAPGWPELKDRPIVGIQVPASPAYVISLRRRGGK